MGSLHPDLLILAAVAQAYGLADAPQNLYGLAQYGTYLPPPASAGDMQAGLSLLGLDSYRLVAPGLKVPDLIQDSIERGHITLAQVRGHPLRKHDYWIVLVAVGQGDWHGICMGLDWSPLSIAHHLKHSLTGFYVVCDATLPGWEIAPPPTVAG